MQKIVISKKCAACGACSMNSQYIKENPDGTASPEGAGIIPQQEIPSIQKIIEACPTKSISLVNSGIVKKTGKEGLRELKQLILSEYKDYKAPMPSVSTYKFNKREYTVPRPYSSNERRYEYKSSSKAEDAGRSELDRILYSQHKALIQQLVVQYKNNKLAQFLEYNKKSGNYYYDIISKFETRFDEFVAEAKDLSDNKIKLPSNLQEHDIKPSFFYKNSTRELDFNLYQIKNLEKLTGVCDLIADKIPSLYSYYIDSDDRDVYVGNKEKTMWCFILNDAIKDIIDDILEETYDLLMSRDAAQETLEAGLRDVMGPVNDSINNKIKTLIDAIDKAIA